MRALKFTSFFTVVASFSLASACSAEEPDQSEFRQQKIASTEQDDDSNNDQSKPPSSEQTREQQELNVAIEMMRAQGMSEDEVKQFRQMMEPMVAAETERKKEVQEAADWKEEEQASQADNEIASLMELVRPSPGVLNVGVKGQVFGLNIRSCSSKAEESGNLMELGWVEAEGLFRGENVLATLSKSHPVGSPTQSFETLQIWLATVRDGEASLDNAEILRKREEEYQAWYTPRQQEIMDGYKVTNEMSVDEMTATMEAQQKALDALDEESAKYKVQYLLAQGAVSIDEGVISILSSNHGWHRRGSGPNPDLYFEIEGAQIYAVAQCS